MERSQDNAGSEAARKGPQGTTIFSRDELDRLIADAVTDAPKGTPVLLRGASEAVAGRVFALEQPRLLIGRADHCDIVVRDPSISSEHARLVQDSDGWRISNLLSTNGTFVNGARATRARLRHGDHIRVGRIEFVFELPDGAAGSTNDSSRRRWLTAGLLAGLVAALAVLGWTLLG